MYICVHVYMYICIYGIYVYGYCCKLQASHIPPARPHRSRICRAAPRATRHREMEAVSPTLGRKIHGECQTHQPLLN